MDKHSAPWPISGVGVIDRSMAVLRVLATGPANLAELAVATGLPRATAHRLALALEEHGMVARTDDGAFCIGPFVATLAAAAPHRDLADLAQPVLDELRDASGESAQLFVRRGDVRVCLAASDRVSGLRDSVPVGAELTMNAGSAARILAAWSADVPAAARYTAADLATIRKRGWTDSVSEREPGVASVSAPVFDADGKVVAALSVSGPVERLTAAHRRRLGPLVAAHANELASTL